MKIILLQNIKGLGKKFDVKEVSDGYARNFLFPKKIAEIAGDKSIKKLEEYKNELKKKEDDINLLFKEIIDKLSEKEFHFSVEADKNDKVFGSIKEEDVKKEIEKFISFVPDNLKQSVIGKIKIKLEKPLKTLGLHTVEIDFPNNKKIKINISLNRISL
ncbi:MAG: 50S ribosomal protein L9 [Patescibacteria group bacterium]|mgnify:CR=1 FL=1